MMSDEELYLNLVDLSKNIDSDKNILNLVKEYEPLINKYSKIKGYIDEDLKSEITIAFIKHIKIFISNM